MKVSRQPEVVDVVVPFGSPGNADDQLDTMSQVEGIGDSAHLEKESVGEIVSRGLGEVDTADCQGVGARRDSATPGSAHGANTTRRHRQGHGTRWIGRACRTKA